LNAEKLARRAGRQAGVPNASAAAVTSVLRSQAAEDEAALAASVAEERARYQAQKSAQQAWTLGTTAIIAAGVYSAYGRDVAASYIVGGLGGYLYLRLLARSVDAVGAQDLESASGGISAQPRLLIPVILTLVYNRYNLLYADQVGRARSRAPTLPLAATGNRLLHKPASCACHAMRAAQVLRPLQRPRHCS